jgi:hypothetical protein
LSQRSEFLRDQRIRLSEKQDGICPSCEMPLGETGYELAHIIPEREWTIAYYGFDVVDHDLNKRATHPGKCNSAAQMDPNGMEAERLAIEIRREIARGNNIA